MPIVRSRRPVNNVPFARDIFLRTTVGTPENVTLEGFDPENGSLFFVILDAPVNGVLSPIIPTSNSTAMVTYTSASLGLDQFTYRVTDGSNTSDVGVVSVQIGEVGEAFSILEFPVEESAPAVVGVTHNGPHSFPSVYMIEGSDYPYEKVDIGASYISDTEVEVSLSGAFTGRLILNF